MPTRGPPPARTPRPPPPIGRYARVCGRCALARGRPACLELAACLGAPAALLALPRAAADLAPPVACFARAAVDCPAARCFARAAAACPPPACLARAAAPAAPAAAPAAAAALAFDPALAWPAFALPKSRRPASALPR